MADAVRNVKIVCPDHEIIVCADDDWKTEKNPGLTKARAAAEIAGVRMIKPEFGPNRKDGDTDFNDLAALEGIEAVTMQLSPPLVHEKKKLPPQGPESTCLKNKVFSRPPAREFIFVINGNGLIPKGIVGAFTATGGTGKTFFLLHLGLAAACGGSFGTIKASRPLNTLAIVAEDDEEEMRRRSWDICKGNFPDKFHALSVYGELAPILKLENGNPVLTESYDWLEETIRKHEGLELLILDPMSRIYGLDENNNGHATVFIQALEQLAKKYQITILFSHHTGKTRSDEITQDMARGASALIDGCRWQAGIVRMSNKLADRYGIDDPRSYIVFDAPKNNYGPDMANVLMFRRCEYGVLEYVKPEEKLLKEKSMALLKTLKIDPEQYTFNELKNTSKGQGIAKELKKEFDKFTQSKDMEKALNYLLKEGLLMLKDVGNSKNPREILEAA
ncbi:MAG: RecA-family ATPase [Desulforhopalus sp.]